MSKIQNPITGSPAGPSTELARKDIFALTGWGGAGTYTNSALKFWGIIETPSVNDYQSDVGVDQYGRYLAQRPNPTNPILSYAYISSPLGMSSSFYRAGFYFLVDFSLPEPTGYRFRAGATRQANPLFINDIAPSNVSFAGLSYTPESGDLTFQWQGVDNAGTEIQQIDTGVSFTTERLRVEIESARGEVYNMRLSNQSGVVLSQVAMSGTALPIKTLLNPYVAAGIGQTQFNDAKYVRTYNIGFNWGNHPDGEVS